MKIYQLLYLPLHLLYSSITSSFSLSLPSSPTHQNTCSPASNDHLLHRRTILTTPLVTAAAAITATSNSAIATATATASKTASTTKSVLLPGSKKEFPFVSFGLQIYNDDVAYKLTTMALEVGYRNFFASVLAGNQKGFAKAVKDSQIPRSDLYICGSVLSNRAKGFHAAYEKTKQGCLDNLEIMSTYGDITQLDMIMLDYPGPDKESIQGQWKALLDFQSEHKVLDLAVSNYNAAQLDAVLSMEEVDSPMTKPCVNQLPFSLAYHPKNLIDYNLERGVLVQSWSPLSRVLNNPNLRPVLASIGTQYGKSPAQVALRWILQSGSGAGFSTQSKKKPHFEEDLHVFDFELTEKEMEELTKLA